ncbi:MAG: exodeoxyribonuclease V subunit alpha [Magnetococcales bacterium]|nr:exodeoxyribonuclease V subunit alpha [Magnetococcales bacterium]
MHPPPETPDPLEILTRWRTRGWVRVVELHLTALLRSRCPDADGWLLLAAALTSHQAGRGHVHLDLAALLEDPNGLLALPPEGSGPTPLRDPDAPQRRLAGIDLPTWLARLDHPALIAAPDGSSDNRTPLVRIGTRLYLRRLWQYEQEVAAWIESRLTTDPRQRFEPSSVRMCLDRLLPLSPIEPSAVDWQRIACARLVQTRFGILTGGPGTGKTTTVVRLLALFLQLSLERCGLDGNTELPRIALAAPTGKAAARLGDAITRELERMRLGASPLDPQVWNAIPNRVTTLHRLLGGQRDSRHFRHDADNPLWLDLLVIDEASMVGLELMADLLRALPPQARLFLIGDKDQLASVEAGALLGTLCQRADGGHYTPTTATHLQEATGHLLDPIWLDPDGRALDQAVVRLRRNYRFASTSGIGQLAQAINAGDAPRIAALRAAPGADLSWLSLRTLEDGLNALIVHGMAWTVPDINEQNHQIVEKNTGGYRDYLTLLHAGKPTLEAPAEAFDLWAGALLRAMAGFQLLCASRQGVWGVEGLNARVEAALRTSGLIETGQRWYVGRPVMITRNDHALGLMNGDIGITLELPVDGAWWTRVAFWSQDGEMGGIRWFAPSRLPPVETVFAMTVHKSQGSEFGQVVLVVPDSLNPILTREWLYTGVTRARERLILVETGEAALLETILSRRVTRAGGALFEG